MKLLNENKILKSDADRLHFHSITKFLDLFNLLQILFNLLQNLFNLLQNYILQILLLGEVISN